MINIFLDDIRKTPEGFVRTYTAQQTIDLLRDEAGNVDILSLDHDLGDDANVGNGYDVVRWIEEQVYTNVEYVPPQKIVIHSANPVGQGKMMAGIMSIKRKSEENSLNRNK